MIRKETTAAEEAATDKLQAPPWLLWVQLCDQHLEPVLIGQPYELELPDGTVVKGTVPGTGLLWAQSRFGGGCTLSFPEIEKPRDLSGERTVRAEVDDKNVEEVKRCRWRELRSPVQLSTGMFSRIIVERDVLPIVFVPGIMGSRLRVRADADRTPDDEAWLPWAPPPEDPDPNERDEKKEPTIAWDADNRTWLGGHMAGRSPAARKRVVLGSGIDKLAPLYTDEGHIPLDRFPHALARGWGAVLWGAFPIDGYSDILEALDTRCWNHPMSAELHLPVYAHGVVWADSIGRSGRRLKHYVEQLIKKCDAEARRDSEASSGPEPSCRKVLIVTHSQGGLVARAACKGHSPGMPWDGIERVVAGVVHGVQPVHGAPSGYWRSKGGFEDGGPGFILGANGAQVTAIFGNIPGGLQLLPSAMYRPEPDPTKVQWLFVDDETGRRPPVALPSTDPPDPYREIYMNHDPQQPWRLLGDPGDLAPGETSRAAPGQPPRRPVSPNARRAEFDGRIRTDVQPFHAWLAAYQHSETHAFHGVGGSATCTVVRFTTRPAPEPTSLIGRIGRTVATPITLTREWWDNRGGFREKYADPSGPREIELLRPSGRGDGTVPETSGGALRGPRASSGPAPENEGAFGDVNHQKAYRDGMGKHVSGSYASTNAFTISAIERIAAFFLRSQT